jgi:hypothetical protein
VRCRLGLGRLGGSWRWRLRRSGGWLLAIVLFSFGGSRVERGKQPGPILNTGKKGSASTPVTAGGLAASPREKDLVGKRERTTRSQRGRRPP